MTGVQNAGNSESYRRYRYRLSKSPRQTAVKLCAPHTGWHTQSPTPGPPHSGFRSFSRLALIFVRQHGPHDRPPQHTGPRPRPHGLQGGHAGRRARDQVPPKEFLAAPEDGHPRTDGGRSERRGLVA